MNAYERFPNSIQQMRMRRSTKVVEVPDAYEFRPGSGWRGRLYGWLWRVLRWGGCIVPHLGTVEVVRFSGLRSKRFLDGILAAINDAHKDFREPREVIMGAADFSALMGEQEVRGALSFEALSFEAGPFKDGRDPSVYGVRVRVLPWIKGWAVI